MNMPIIYRNKKKIKENVAKKINYMTYLYIFHYFDKRKYMLMLANKISSKCRTYNETF